MSVKANATTAAQAWSTNFAASGTKYTEGINAVTVPPGQLAAAQKNAYIQNVTASANVWASKVAAVSLQSWQQAATTTGAQRLATGATKGAAKYQAFANNFLPVLTSVVQALPARGSFEQNMSRFTTYATNLHSKKGSF